MRKFRTDDVVLLDGLRCSGAEHDGCQKACMIFWREAWLSKVEDTVSSQETRRDPQSTLSHIDSDGREKLRARLKTLSGPKTYFCQASELLNATNELSRWERFGKSFSEVHAGNCSSLEMAQRIGIWVFWRIRRVFLGAYARGTNKSTAAGGINLQPGAWVEVEPMESITETLNESAHNRGLYFTPAMRVLCGEQHRVEKKVDYFWRAHFVGAPVSPLVDARAANSPIGGRFGFAGLRDWLQRSRFIRRAGIYRNRL